VPAAGLNLMPLFPALTISSVPDPVLGAGAAALLGAGLLLALQRANRRPVTPTPPAVAAHPPAGRAHGPPEGLLEPWEGPPEAAGDRRGEARRGGYPTAVELIGPDPGPPKRGFVMDRAAGGLRLSVEQPFAVGAVVGVRACNAPLGTPWAEVSVRWCEADDARYEIGCQFVGEEPSNVLSTFD
jgi:PilZ domain